MERTRAYNERVAIIEREADERNRMDVEDRVGRDRNDYWNFYWRYRHDPASAPVAVHLMSPLEILLRPR